MDTLFFDIETTANQEAIDMLPEPTAPANYKDAEKIAAYIVTKRIEQAEKAALDPDTGKVAAIGLSVSGKEIISINRNEATERDVIIFFWNRFAETNAHSCGYNIIGFDLPFLLRRSFALGIEVPIRPHLAKYQTEPTCDLMGILYNWGQAKGLKWVCKRYGIDNPLPDLEGSQVKDMDAETLRKYVENDVNLVVKLHEMMNGIYF